MKLLKLFLLVFLAASMFAFSSAITCNTGDLASTCYISSAQSFLNNELISGNNLVIQSTGNITNLTNDGKKVGASESN